MSLFSGIIRFRCGSLRHRSYDPPQHGFSQADRDSNTRTDGAQGRSCRALFGGVRCYKGESFASFQLRGECRPGSTYDWVLSQYML